MESANATGSTDHNSNATPQVPATPSSDTPLNNLLNLNSDIAISECMERLGTRLNMMETELKYAWRALDLLSQEYVKMWRRLEKLEGLLYEQQTVITQLLDFYSSVERKNGQLTGGEGEQLSCDGLNVPIAGTGISETTSELDALQEALKLAEGSGRENKLSDALNTSGILSGSSALSAEASEIIKELQIEDMLHLSDEAFYRSLNKAYKGDFMGFDSNAISVAASSQLGMIWEEAEEGDENGSISIKRDISGGLDMSGVTELKDESMSDVFSALDYKDYRNNVSCVKEDELVQLSRLNALDPAALEKLHELDRLTDKLQKDSNDLKELQTRLSDSTQTMKDLKPSIMKSDTASTTERNFTAEDTSAINDQAHQIISDAELENWNFGTQPQGLAEMLLLAGMTSTQKPKSETVPLDLIKNSDAGVTANLTGYSTLSPRHKVVENNYTSCSRISSLLQSDVSSPKHASELQTYSSYPGINLSPKHAINSESYSYASPKHVVDIQNFTYGPLTTSSKHSDLQGFGYGIDSSGVVSASYSSAACTSPSIHSASSGKLSNSPTLSIISVRTKQDEFRSSSGRGELITGSPSPTSPPPPAPEDKDIFVMSLNVVEQNLTSSMDLFGSVGENASITSLSLDQQQGRLTPRTPHSPKSPRTSPKRIVKSTSSNMAAAKSDSGLSSMSGGWSSLEKSPGSPKSSKGPNVSSYPSGDTGILLGRVPCYSHSRSQSATHLSMSPKHLNKSAYKQESDPYSYGRTLSPLPPTPTSTSLLVGGHHLSAFTSVKMSTRLDSSSPSVANEIAGTFVPSPAPSSDVSSNSSRRSQRLSDFQVLEGGSEYLFRSEKSTIYSVAGSHRQPYTSVFTRGSSSASMTATNLGYPDLIRSYPLSDTLSGSSSSSQYLPGSEPNISRSHSNSSSVYAKPKTAPNQYPSGKSSTGKSGYSNVDGYKPTGYRNAYHPEQITDALTYYPTSTHGTSMPANVPTTYYQPPAQWLSRSVDSDRYTSSFYERDYYNEYNQNDVYPKKSLMDPSAQYRAEEGYPIRDHQWSTRDWNSELDIRNQNYESNERYKNNEFFDTNGVIVSQSGYISIASDVREDSNGFEKVSKKSKRGGSIKTAMSSVSNWLPDLHFSKRHRSNSLPADEFLDQSEVKPKTSLKGKLQKQLSSTLAKRKVGKSHLVTTFSGMIQKAKKKVLTSHSLSDSEQPVMDWGTSGGTGSGRFSALSCRSEDSVFSQSEIANNEDNSALELAETRSTLPELDLSIQDDREPNEKIPTSVSSLFPTVGEIKLNQKSAPGSSDESVTSESARKYSQVNIGGPPREFAVSRALGKYRQRQSSTVLDEFPAQDDGNQSTKSGNSKESAEKTPEEIEDLEPLPKETAHEVTETEEKKPSIVEPSVTAEPPQMEQPRTVIPVITPQISDEGIESSPSMQSVRSSQKHGMSRHQISLEIPWGYRSSGEVDEDNRSMHSWRSTSRVSSRRQSTEDSIDSEDEWYCYELRKLEELERQTQVEKDTMDHVETYRPDERVKEKMSFVLKELRLKVKTTESEPEKQVHVRGVMKVELTDIPESQDQVEETVTPPKPPIYERKPSIERRSSIERRRLPDISDRRSSFDRCLPRELPQRPNELIQPKEIKPEQFEEDKDQSSGDTSGPDSPHESFDEMDYEEPQPEEESRISSNGYQNKISGSLSREGSVSVGPSEMSVSIQGEWNSEETGTVRDGSISIPGSEWENDVREGDSASTITPFTQKTKMEGERKEKEEPVKEEGPKDGGVASKWKLLKALKDRKAEEKEAKAEAAAGGKADDSTAAVSKLLLSILVVTKISALR